MVGEREQREAGDSKMVEHPAAPNLDCDHITLQHSLHMRRLRWIQSRGGGDGRRAIRSERVASSGRIVCDCAPATAVAAAVTAAVAAVVAVPIERQRVAFSAQLDIRHAHVLALN